MLGEPIYAYWRCSVPQYSLNAKRLWMVEANDAGWSYKDIARHVRQSAVKVQKQCGITRFDLAKRKADYAQEALRWTLPLHDAALLQPLIPFLWDITNGTTLILESQSV